MDALWVKTTSDEFELPVAVADSCKELARMCQTRTDTIYSAISHAKAGTRSRTCYKKVEYEDGELDEFKGKINEIN